MNCDPKYNARKKRCECTNKGCGRTWKAKGPESCNAKAMCWSDDPEAQERFKAKQTAIKNGPGTQLQKLIKELGFAESTGCGCGDMIQQMNAWGKNCIEHIDEITAKLSDNKKTATFSQKLHAGKVALQNGLPLTVRGLVLLAVERAG